MGGHGLSHHEVSHGVAGHPEYFVGHPKGFNRIVCCPPRGIP